MRNILSISILFILGIAIEAGGASLPGDFIVNICIENKLTHRAAISHCELLEYKADSTVTVAKTFNYLGGHSQISFEKPPQKGQYKLYISPGRLVEKSNENSIWSAVEPDEAVAPTIVDIELPDNASSPYDFPTIYISSRKSTALKEVSVTASKVMFYHKGDTLIYNADAFVMAEGSMLDALIEQMPGVELKPDGQIFVNGQKIDNLLLNGKDLFNGKRELMLENLEAYTVKDIAIYKKRTRLGELLDYNTGGEARVMDVRLKRQYLTGFLGNATAGYGTHSRYMARLFGMLLSDNFSASAYAGANNLSDKKKPGREDKSWSIDNMDKGVQSLHQAGVSYNAQGFAGKWELTGSAEVERACTDIINNNNTETLGNAGNTFRYDWKKNNTGNLNVSTSHNFFVKLGSWGDLDIRPMFKYNKNEENESFVSAMSRNKMDNISEDLVSNSFESGFDSLPDLMNKSKKSYSSKGHELSASLGLRSNIKLHRGTNPNALTIAATVDYDNSRNNATDRYRTHYYGVDGMSDANYLKRNPNNNYKLDLNADFLQFFKFRQIQLPVTYQYIEEHKDNKSDIYGLPTGRNRYLYHDDITGRSDNTGAWISSLSYHAINKTSDHILQLNPFTGSLLNSRTHYLFFMLHAKLTFRHNTLDFTTGQNREYHTRNHIIPYIQLTSQWGNPQKWEYILNLWYYVRPIDIMNLVDIPSLDPLTSHRGNPDLKNSDIYHLNFNVNRSRGQQRHDITLETEYIKEPFGYIYMIDMINGYRSFYPTNLGYNFNADIRYKFFTRFGQQQQFDISNATGLHYSSNNGGYVKRMDQISGREELKLNWRKSKYRIGVFADAEVSRYLYSNNTYDNITPYKIRYGANAVLNLPCNWSASTDLSMYTRGGYNVDKLNRTDVVWNARVSKSIMNGRLMFAVDGYDLLNQLSNIEYIVDGQIRSETVNNVIPSYVLFHVSWRFNKNLKK